MEIKTIKIENPDSVNFILGQSHFIKTVEDIYEAMVSTVPMAKFGLALFIYYPLKSGMFSHIVYATLGFIPLMCFSAHTAIDLITGSNPLPASVR